MKKNKHRSKESRRNAMRVGISLFGIAIITTVFASDYLSDYFDTGSATGNGSNHSTISITTPNSAEYWNK